VLKAAPYYLRADVDGDTLRVQAIDLLGNIVDECLLNSRAKLDPDGVRDAAAFSSAVAAGGFITILGKDLSWTGGTTALAGVEDTLEGVQVKLNGRPLPLLFVGRTQVNSQLPYGTVGTAQVELSGPNGSSAATVEIRRAAPAIFHVRRGPDIYPALLHVDGRLVSKEQPASPGEWLSLYMTGLGPVDPPVESAHASASLHRKGSGGKKKGAK